MGLPAREKIQFLKHLESKILVPLMGFTHYWHLTVRIGLRTDSKVSSQCFLASLALSLTPCFWLSSCGSFSCHIELNMQFAQWLSPSCYLPPHTVSFPMYSPFLVSKICLPFSCRFPLGHYDIISQTSQMQLLFFRFDKCEE